MYAALSVLYRYSIVVLSHVVYQRHYLTRWRCSSVYAQTITCKKQYCLIRTDFVSSREIKTVYIRFHNYLNFKSLTQRKLYVGYNSEYICFSAGYNMESTYSGYKVQKRLSAG